MCARPLREPGKLPAGWSTSSMHRVATAEPGAAWYGEVASAMPARPLVETCGGHRARAADGPPGPPGGRGVRVMTGVWFELVLVLVLLNAGFAGSEVALISLREGQLRRLELESSPGRLVARLARDPNQFLSTIQIGITLAGFLASAAAAVSLAQPLVGPLGFLGGAAEAVAVVLVTVVLGELAPKRIALQRPEPWAKRAARPLAWVTSTTRPAVWLLTRTTDLLVRLAGGDPAVQREA